MNTSDMTVFIARGIYLFAKYQNLTTEFQAKQYYCDVVNWNDWLFEASQREIEFVKQAQFLLFDQVNAQFNY